MDLDDLEAISRLDSLNVLATVEAFGDQVHDAWTLGGRVTNLPAADGVTSVLVLGMGGSGASGDIVGALVEPRLPVPFHVLKGYGPLPEWVGRNTLVFAVSYSGNTAETLDTFEEAHGRGCRAVAISSGGRLAELAAEFGTSLVTIPGGMQPRTALGYLTMPLLHCLIDVGLVPDMKADLVESLEALGSLAESCNRKRPVGQNPAKDLAVRLSRKIPIVYGGSGLGAAVARRFKCDLNEYGKVPAFWNEIPEMNHNEICAWDGPQELSDRFTGVMILEGRDDSRIERRWEVTKQLIERGRGDALELTGDGRSGLTRILGLLLITQLAAIYVGIERDVDPGPVEVIERLKSELSDSRGEGDAS